MPVSVWQTVFRNFHTPLVRSPADRTKVVTMAALRKFAGFLTFSSFTFSKLSNGFSAFRSWKSPTASSSAEHRAAAYCICPIDSSSSCQLGFFFPAGGSGFLLGEMMAGNSSCDDMSEGLSEGRDGVRARPEGWALSADWDLGRGILYGRWYFLKK